MVFNLFVAQCFKKSWLKKMSQINCIAHENISCKSPIELPYYSCKTFKQICIQYGKASKLIVDPQHYLQCECCKGIEKIKIIKHKKTIEKDPVVNKKVKN